MRREKRLMSKQRACHDALSQGLSIRESVLHIVSDGLPYFDRISESATLYPGWLYNIVCKMIPIYCPFPGPSPGWTCPEAPSTGPSTVDFPREGTIVAHK